MDAPKTPEQQQIDRLSAALNGVLDRNDQEATTEKSWQYMRLRTIDLYLKGQQYLAPVPGGSFGVDLSPISQISSPTEEGEQTGAYDYVANMLLNYQRKFVAAAGLRPFPHVKSLPDDPSSVSDRLAAKQGDYLSQWLDNKWQTRVLNPQLCMWAFAAGTVYGHVSMSADAEKFGTTTYPIMEMVPKEIPGEWGCPDCGWRGSNPDQMLNITTQQPDHSCPSCAAPMAAFHYTPPQTVQTAQQTGTQEHPNVGPVLTLHTAYTTTVPSDATSIENAAWLHNEYEEQPGRLLQIFGDELRQKMSLDTYESGDGPTSTTGASVRASLASVAGITRPAGLNRWTYRRTWFTPALYEMVKDEKIRQELYASFPKGLKICRVGKHIVRLTNESLAAVWAAAKPECTPTLYCDPYAWSVKGLQDSLNDALNIMIAHAERKIPTYIANPKLGLADQLNKKRFAPGSMIESAPAYGGSIREQISTLETPNGEISEYSPLISMFQNISQDLLGLNPQLWGGGENSKTALDASNKLRQALAQIGPFGEQLSYFWAAVKMAAVNLIREHGLPGSVKVPTGATTSEEVDIDALRNGKFSFDPNVGVPLTYGEKRDAISALVKENPDAFHALAFDLPENIAVVREYLVPGIPEMLTPNEGIVNYANKVIEQLLDIGRNGFVTEPAPDGSWILPDGFQFDPFLDDPQINSQVVAQWAREFGRGQDKEQGKNPNGYKLVLAWGLTQKMNIPPPMPAPPPDGGKPQPAPEQAAQLEPPQQDQMPPMAA